MELEDKLFTNETPEERYEILKASAERCENISYSKPFTEEELEKMKDDFAQKSINLSEIEEELTEIKESFKMKMKPLKQETSYLLTGIKLKTEIVTENVFLLSNQDNNTMEYRNNAGELVHFRKLLPEEKQTRLKIKTGTND